MTTFEEFTKKAVENGWLIDRRAEMPRGQCAMRWGKRAEQDILGVAIHQNGSPNQDPVETALYHTSKGNHITPGVPLPGLCYPLVIGDGPVQLCGDLGDKTYATGAPEGEHPGDENRHLIAVVIMGRFAAPGFRGGSPTYEQVSKLERTVTELQKAFDFGPEGVFGHDDFGKSTCPGSELQRWKMDKRFGAACLDNDMEWQQALLAWNPECLPKYGPDGDWGRESQTALVQFQKIARVRITGVQDPFTEMRLLHILKHSGK